MDEDRRVENAAARSAAVEALLMYTLGRGTWEQVTKAASACAGNPGDSEEARGRSV